MAGLRNMHTYKSPWVLLILIIVGALLGSLIGNALGDSLPILKVSQQIGLETTTLDLGVLTINFGFLIKMNVASVFGFVLAYLLYRVL